MAEDPKNKNWAKRLAGVALCSLPLLLAVACAVFARPVSSASAWLGLILAAAACLVGALNFNLRFVRPLLHKSRHGSLEGYRFVSGLPVVATLVQVSGCVAAFGSPTVGFLGIVSCLIDADGLSWFPVVTWKDGSLWDA